jgi:plastocyanin
VLSKIVPLALLSVAALIASPASASETIRVVVDKMSFDPPRISAHVGDTIEWVSSDFVVHTATAKNKDWDVVMPAKGAGRVTLAHPGEVDYFCRFHPNMTGQIAVAP